MYYEVPQGNKSNRNFNQAIFFFIIEDDLDEIGIERTHQDSNSKDILTCDIYAKTRSRVEKYRNELRRICRADPTCYGDDEYAMLDWEGGKWIPEAKRWHWNMLIFAFRSGYVFA